jgi:hypothetical protein
MMRHPFYQAALAATLGALAMSGAMARSTADLPAPQKAGAVEYLSGGIGKDEARAIEQASAHWPLTLEFAIKGKPHAEFAADVAVKIHDAQGHTALSTVAGGPFLLARLQPGRYAVDATYAGKTLHEQAVVAQGHPAKALFLWPAGVDGHAS